MNKHELLQLNRQADAFAQTQIPKLREMIEHLKPLGITHFAYDRFVGQDKYIILCPENNWVRENYGYAKDREWIIDPQLDRINRKHKLSLWQSFSSESHVLLEYLRSIDTNHGMILFRNSIGDVSESFHFASTNSNEKILDFYINNIHLLEAFADYFTEKMSDILDHTIPGKLVHIPKSDLISKVNTNITIPEAFTQILDSLLGYEKPNKKNVFNLTPKQYEVFQFLKQGYSSKQIALKLGKSHRTVEGYATAILKKFDLMSRRDLIDFPPNLMNKVLPHE